MPVEDPVLLPPAVMARVDAAAIAAGTPGPVLMENAGRAVTRAITARFAPCPVAVLCGPGNNGGDGFVIARRLRAAGWPVRLARLVPTDRLRGDAAWAAGRWNSPTEALAPSILEGAGLVVDALFGAGLARDITGPCHDVIAATLAKKLPVVAVDMPSGVDGTTGEIRGIAARARLTVTFVRAKPGHYLLPGRLHCGELVVTDIGIADRFVAEQDIGLRRNEPSLWRQHLRRRTPTDHKYRFGHAYILGGPAATTGATRMAATAALRSGAGLVSILCEEAALATYAAHMTAVMTKPYAEEADLARLLADPRVTARLYGPGAGVTPATRRRTEMLLETGRPTVLDADALTVFRDDRRALFARLGGHCVLTPHDGEYARLFAHRGSRLERARKAAAESGAVILLKGGDTVVAEPGGSATLLADAPPELATAGSGDVLAGILTGLLAQGLPAFAAASAAVWIHAEAARRAGGLLTAEDLLPPLSRVMDDLLPPPAAGSP